MISNRQKSVSEIRRMERNNKWMKPKMLLIVLVHVGLLLLASKRSFGESCWGHIELQIQRLDRSKSIALAITTLSLRSKVSFCMRI